MVVKLNHVVKYFSLILLVGFIWTQTTGSLTSDESFYNNGNLEYQRFYKYGKADGKWTHYYENGNIWIEGNYNDGIKVGLWTTYYKSGREWTKGNYKNNERNGEWIFLNEDGTVFEEKKY